jgi:hypothetical protein
MQEPSPLSLLAALGSWTDPTTHEFALYDIKPFFDWRGTLLRNTVITMQLLSVKEIDEVTEYVARFPEASRAEKMQIELVCRSLKKFNAMPLYRKEELDTFNTDHQLNLDEVDFIRIKVKEFERIVLERLDAVYYGLQQKQIRFLQGISLCHVTGNTFPSNKLPEGSRKMLYSLAEIICPEGWDKMGDEDKADIDMLNRGATSIISPSAESPEKTAVSEKEKPYVGTLDGTYRCAHCNAGPFDTQEEVLIHVERECTRVGLSETASFSTPAES